MKLALPVFFGQSFLLSCSPYVCVSDYSPLSSFHCVLLLFHHSCRYRKLPFGESQLYIGRLLVYFALENFDGLEYLVSFFLPFPTLLLPGRSIIKKMSSTQ